LYHTGRSISITVEEKEKDTYSVTIEDNGTGIKDISAAFSIGNRNGQESPLNEHGYGMKHALAAANKSNDSWKVVTKLSDNNYYTE
jgi:DNA topoisomerase VI, subunit B